MSTIDLASVPPELYLKKLREADARAFAALRDDDLLERAVRGCRSNRFRRGRKHPRWAAVMDTFALGSNFAAGLCRRFGLDPDELVKR